MKNDGFKFNTYSEKLNSTNGGGSNKSLNSSKSSSTRFNSSANYAKVPKSNLMHSKLPRIGGKVQKTKPKRSSNTNFEVSIYLVWISDNKEHLFIVYIHQPFFSRI